MAFHKQPKGKAPFERMLRRLDLSEEQRAQVEQIVTERRTATQKGTGGENHKALQELAISTVYDPQRVQVQARLHAERIVARTETFHRVYQVLTPEQQAKLAELRSAREATRGEARSRIIRTGELARCGPWSLRLPRATLVGSASIQAPEFVFGLLQNGPLPGIQRATCSIDIEHQHRHRGTEGFRLATFAALRRCLQRACDALGVRPGEDAGFQVQGVALAHDASRPV